MPDTTQPFSDRDDNAWSFYEAIYKNQPFFKEFSWKRSKNCPYIKNERHDFKFSGDLIFNFNDDHNGIRLRKYLHYISDSAERSRLEKILKEKNHTYANISLFLCDGNMQAAKQGIGYDRGDTFIWALDQYFRGISECLLNHSTWQSSKYLRDFLDYIKEISKCEPKSVIYYYCSIFYNLPITDNNKKLIDQLINSGAKAIDNEESAVNYINLAREYEKKSVN